MKHEDIDDGPVATGAMVRGGSFKHRAAPIGKAARANPKTAFGRE
jgi:hypothetical protein